jgi:hypothetical protein
MRTPPLNPPAVPRRRTWRAGLRCCIAWCVTWSVAMSAQAGVVVIAHPSLHKLDTDTVQRIYTGKVIVVGGVSVSPVHLPVGSPQRQHFMAELMQQSEDAYQAYWTVRRYVGKGTPPREVHNLAEALGHVGATPGGMAYVDDTDLPAGANVVWRLGR